MITGAAALILSLALLGEAASASHNWAIVLAGLALVVGVAGLIAMVTGDPDAR